MLTQTQLKVDQKKMHFGHSKWGVIVLNAVLTCLPVVLQGKDKTLHTCTFSEGGHFKMHLVLYHFGLVTLICVNVLYVNCIISLHMRLTINK